MKVSENEVMSISNVISNERFDIKNEVQKLIVVLKSSNQRKILQICCLSCLNQQVDTTRFIHSIFSGKKLLLQRIIIKFLTLELKI